MHVSYNPFKGINPDGFGISLLIGGGGGLGRGWGVWGSSICAWKLYIILRG